jgi:hypothetical protein
MKRWPISLRQAGYIIAAILLFLTVMNFNARLEERARLQKRAREVSAQATQVIQTQTALQTKMAYALSDQAVYDWAYSEGHLYRPGDHVVVPVGAPGEAPLEASQPPPVPTPMQNWEVWRELFFGE